MKTLDTIFVFESTRERQRMGPLLREREEFLRSMLQQGTSHKRLRSIASMLLHVVQIMELKTLRMVDKAEIETSAIQWTLQTEFRNRNGQQTGVSLFRYVALKWLRFHNSLLEPSSRVEPDDTYLEQFVYHLSSIRGLSVDTVQTSRRRASAFLRWNSRAGRPLYLVTITELDSYLRSKLEAGYLPRSISSICSALRLFFQFADKQNWNEHRVASAIQRPRISRYDSGARGPQWSEVRRMLDHDFGSTLPDLRGDAILALAAIYALRNCEIIRLKLNDFDWGSEILTIRRAKSLKVQRFPIQIEVGEKIIRYLRDARPRCGCKNLFVTLRPPYRPLDPACLWVVVSQRMKALGIESKNLGTHALRHACATYLLHEGTSLPDIAHFLGHSDLKSVSIYAKHDLHALRQVAAISLADLDETR